MPNTSQTAEKMFPYAAPFPAAKTAEQIMHAQKATSSFVADCIAVLLQIARYRRLKLVARATHRLVVGLVSAVWLLAQPFAQRDGVPPVSSNVGPQVTSAEVSELSGRRVSVAWVIFVCPFLCGGETVKRSGLRNDA